MEAIFYQIAHVFYNIYLHPLRHIPGPKAAAASRIPHIRHLLGGSIVQNLEQMHAQYGDVVRVTPDELSFISGETAWQDIYGLHYNKSGENTNRGYYEKDRAFYPPITNNAPSVLLATEADHQRQRRVLAHAFSEKALKEQEPLLQVYVDLLVNQLHKRIEEDPGCKVDLVEWYNWTTFDIIADFTFGESFHCLENTSTHEKVKMVFEGARTFSMFYVLHHYPIVKRSRNLVVSKKSMASRIDFVKWCRDQADRRIKMESTRPDFFTYILRNRGAEGKRTMSVPEMHSTMQTFLSAGSETTATLMSGVTFLLLKYPECMQRLVEEIRGSFASNEDITIDGVNKATYMTAVLQEALRVYPPVPTGFPRKVPAGGDNISGHWVPENTTVYMSQYPANHSSRNFVDPHVFIPDRWLGTDPRFDADKRVVVQPFSFGARNCLGKNLAYAEMRLMLAKMIWHFDIELCKESANWFEENRCFTLWEKPPLMVKLTAVER
ncbi:hypothetical protein LTR04_001512 [Oleoguttula sp. CCFEE 6159]|nr:hypothetical protein LTR04_001512 [Oleoguttula sp. CCFEE 6159]